LLWCQTVFVGRRCPVLVLTRKSGEEIRIGELMTVTVLEMGRNRVKLGFSGPSQVPVVRGELAGPAPPRRTQACRAGRLGVPRHDAVAVVPDAGKGQGG
jgi:carbon storage regulator CsrA